MIEFAVTLVLIIAFIFLIYPIISIPTFLINVSLIIIVALRVKVDLKENKMHAYYMWSAFITAIILVAKEYGFLKIIFDLLFKNLILDYTQAILLIFMIAHLIGISRHYIQEAVNDMKKKK
ncbi:MAG: hypothetical protein ABIJ08_00045 [Nanoarchaeota archaeon]